MKEDTLEQQLERRNANALRLQELRALREAPPKAPPAQPKPVITPQRKPVLVTTMPKKQPAKTDSKAKKGRGNDGDVLYLGIRNVRAPVWERIGKFVDAERKAGRFTNAGTVISDAAEAWLKKRI